MTTSAGVARRAAALPVGGALVLVAAATPVLDDARWSSGVHRGAALLLAVAVAVAVDEADAAVAAAVPTPFAARVLARLRAVSLLVVPAAVAVGAWTAGAGGRVAVHTVRELLALVVLAVAVAAALRRWGGVQRPSTLTGPVLVCALMLTSWAARYLRDLPGAAVSGVVVVAAATLLALALRDPATARERALRR